MLELSAQVCQILRRAVHDNVLFILHSVPVAFVANPELVRAPLPVVPLGFNSKIVTG